MCFLCPPVFLEPFAYLTAKSKWLDAFFFCFNSKKHGAIWSSYFTAGTAVVNLIINIWLLVNLHKLDNYLEDNEKWNFMPPGIIPLMYIELILNIVLFCLSFVLMVGVNRGFQGKQPMYTWIWGFAGIRWYEVFLGIYVLVWLGSQRIPEVVFMFPESNLIAAYWLINIVIMIWCMVTVSKYYLECNHEMYGKEKRVRYFKMLSNIRSAALTKSSNLFSGTATPRSMFMSRSTLGPGQSQASLSVASYPVKQPRSHLPSTASSMAPSYRGGPPSQSGYPPQPQQPYGGGGYPPGQPRPGGYPPPQHMGGGGYPPGHPGPGGYPPPQPMGGGGYPPKMRGAPPPQRQPQQPYLPPAMQGMPRPQPQYPGQQPPQPGFK